MIVKYEGQQIESEVHHLHKFDDELRFVNATGVKSLKFPHDTMACIAMCLVIEAREQGQGEVDLTNTLNNG